ncbi:MAG: DMT family transporter [Jannaschia helgolandensis]|jgi:drug/metabolite transporter (DMT)-like permease|uniref:DMT family transporter n=1 Tax=Jannaschia helgolandensis TaxID=188906 RepID=UPI003C77AF4A|tara:strand:- start:516 stop:1394 length:879 start_codon:yes stop_codon:yes gene_type:complete
MTDTLRGAALMVGSMACFALEDGLIKALSGTFPAAQIIWMLGLGGSLAFVGWLIATGQTVWSPHYLRPQVLLRSGFEVAGTLCFVSALALIPLATASAVIQATPLVVAMGAAVFLGARVGWRRWLAIGVGFAGVLIILRPGSSAFDPATLLAVGGMLGLAARDLVTRTMPGIVSGARLSLHAFASLVPAGLLLQFLTGASWVIPDAAQIGILAIAVAVGMVGYLAIVGATRLGDISVVSSFRYSRMLFALIVGMVAFGERPDALMIVGVVIVIGSGVFTLLREARLRAASQA